MKTILFCLLLASSYAIAQTYRIDLPNTVSVNENSKTFTSHITILKSSPNGKLILPSVSTAKVKFWHNTIMVVPSGEGQVLYIDRNNNQDLRDDGPPCFFPDSANDFTFSDFLNNDPRQKRIMQLQRKPHLPDFILQDKVDGDGNLTEETAKLWRWGLHDSSFSGKRGTFYFDEDLFVRKGSFRIFDHIYNVGLYDYSFNGLFNDSDDVFIIDQNDDGDMSDPTERFALNDVFTIVNICLKIDTLDEYGRWVELITTTEQPTFYYLKKYAERISGDETMGAIDTSVWDISLPTIDGDTISLRDYRGKYLLLNFWGDWCSPCLAEIPFLVNAQKDYKSKPLNIISILTSNRFDNVKKIQLEKGMTWPQLIETDEVMKQFQIKSWPTNILIIPTGVYYRVGSVTPTFFALKLR